MKATKKAMRAEAVERMKLLELSNETIEAFEKEKRVLISDQYSMGKDTDGSDGSDDIKPKDIYLTYHGVVWSLYTTAPTEERLKLIKEVEKKFDVLVYHIHRCEVNPDMVLYAMLVVERNSDEWELSRDMTIKGLPDCVGPVYGYGGFEYGSLPVKPVWGCLLRTN